MIAAGEDPKFIARRLIIAASEDVGNADPRALTVAVSAAQALDWVGLPEAQFALAQAATYIATAPKSNRSGSAYWAAVSDVDERGSLPVPLHLRQAPYARMKQHGIGVGYRYSHEFEGADVEQQYLPDELAERRYYLRRTRATRRRSAGGWPAGQRRGPPPRPPDGPRKTASPPRGQAARRQEPHGHA